MSINSEPGIRCRRVIGLTVLATFIALAAGWSLVNGWASSPTLAHAGLSEPDFCQVTDADLLADRSPTPSPRAGVQLLANRRNVGPGEVITARLANFTAKNFSSGAEFKIQRYGPSGWQTDASSPDGPWPRSAAILKAGKTRGCYRYFVEEGQPGGRYRFLTILSARNEIRTKKFPEVAKFTILKPAG